MWVRFFRLGFYKLCKKDNEDEMKQITWLLTRYVEENLTSTTS